MADRAESKPTPRVVLMEFRIALLAIMDGLSTESGNALLKQLGEDEAPEGKRISIFVPVAEAEGGPKAVIDAEAKVAGRFRAVAKDSFDQGHEAIPPTQQKFELKPL